MQIHTNRETLKMLSEQSGICEGDTERRGVRIVVDQSCCGGATFGLEVDMPTGNDFMCDTGEILFMMEQTLCKKYGDLSILMGERGYLVKPVVPLKSTCGDCRNSGNPDKLDNHKGCSNCSCGK